MKKITKKKSEPKSLTAYRAAIPAKNREDAHIYHDFTSKTKAGCENNETDNLRRQLLEDQGYICCYCMAKISCQHSKIEHFKPQTKCRQQQISYKNLFVACEGGEGNSKKQQHCDTYKGESELQAINLLSDIEDNIHYEKSGRIFSTNHHIDQEINTILNLNQALLVSNRKTAHNNLIKNLLKTNWNTHILEKKLDQYKNRDKQGHYKAYCQLLVYFLTKKLRAKGVQI